MKRKWKSTAQSKAKHQNRKESEMQKKDEKFKKKSKEKTAAPEKTDLSGKAEEFIRPSESEKMKEDSSYETGASEKTAEITETDMSKVVKANVSDVRNGNSSEAEGADGEETSGFSEESLEVGPEGQDYRPDTLTFKENNAGREETPIKKKAGMVKKQKIMIIAFAATAVVLALVYFLVLLPIFKERTAEEPEVIEELIDGEVRDENGKSILMFPHVEKKNLESITVSNIYGDYTCVRNPESDTESFYIKEHPQSPLDAETFTQLVVDAGYSVIVRRITENCTDFSTYGLAEENNPAAVTVKDLDGNQYTYYIGNMIPSQGGYYCRYKDRNALYVIPSSVSSTLLSSSESLITPILGFVLTQEEAMRMDELIIQKNGQPFISLKYKANNTNEIVQSSYEILYPTAYVANDENVSSTMLMTLASIEGYSVVAAGDGTPEGLLYKNEKLMAEYGFYDNSNQPFEIYYRSGDMETIILLTDSGSDAYYFAYSYIYDTIVLIEKETVPFLEWDLLDFISNSIFQEYIKDVTAIEVNGKLDYKQQTHDVSEKFFYGWDEDETLVCKAESTGYVATGNTVSKNPIQAFYQTALRLKIQGYVSEENFDMSQAEKYAEMKITFADGTERTYTFYRFGGYCYFEIDGAGDFYSTLTQVNKLLTDAVRAANGATVTPTDEYSDLPDIYLPKVQ